MLSPVAVADDGSSDERPDSPSDDEETSNGSTAPIRTHELYEETEEDEKPSNIRYFCRGSKHCPPWRYQTALGAFLRFVVPQLLDKIEGANNGYFDENVDENFDARVQAQHVKQTDPARRRPTFQVQTAQQFKTTYYKSLFLGLIGIPTSNVFIIYNARRITDCLGLGELSKSDVHERVSQYFELCHEIIDDHGWRIFFTGDDGRKQLCSILIKSLEPTALREEIDRTARFQTLEAREDEVVLHDLIYRKALDHEKANQSQRRAKRDRDRGDREAERPAMRADLEQLAERETDGDKGLMDDDEGVPVSDTPPTDDGLREAVERLL
ncbi:hypothetical protein ON010_g15783 [Phytophthora cinnamomi]|nr:hypothetical protein ON010_g15783 [Phytophthora cinnamomi]